tara:strand:- start:1577 stop:2035 length:459 start_codon:yes stop_codon:yes gene_type:complete
MARENADTLTKILNLDLFDDTKTTGALKNQKDFNNKIESIRKDNLDKMNFTLGEKGEIMTKDGSPLKKSNLEKYTLAFEKEKRQFLRDMVRLGTSYPSQALASLRVEESRPAGQGGQGGKRPTVGTKATANGVTYTYDGQNFVDQAGNIYNP